MEEWCLPLFLVFLSHILSEIFKCCGAKERSLGLGDTEFGPTFSSDLSPPAARPQGRSHKDSSYQFQFLNPAKLEGGGRGGHASANGKRPWSSTSSTHAVLRTPDLWTRPFRDPPELPKSAPQLWTVEIPTDSPQWLYPHVYDYYCLWSNFKPSFC